jgi:AcrR family transcriptional regulator
VKTTAKLAGAERRAAIIQAVRRVFAEKGFDGTTTRELADAAGVSEALLFRHFPNKEALFSAMLHSCCNAQELGRFERLQTLEPSTSTLVLMVHFLTALLVGGSASDGDERAISNRLMLRSLAEDGEFARVLLRKVADAWIPKIEECLAAAGAAGDAVTGPVGPGLAGWFSHHLAEVLLFHLLPPTPVVNYQVPRADLVAQAVWFILRGMGLKEKAIQHYYNPAALALFEA